MLALAQRNPALAHWSQQQYEELFDPEHLHRSSLRFAWVAENDTDTSAIVAFLVSHKIDAEWEVENIVVSDNSRRRGVATLLLSTLIAQARIDGGTAIFLEVRASNHNARALYRKLGFDKQGLRKSYYSNPSEDAVLYWLAL
jgi:[ribosomal protein S18]-alanine N-acetyltransferase